MKKKTKGVLGESLDLEDYGFEKLIYPSFFLGMNYEPRSPFALTENESHSLKEGQFFILHTFEGHATSLVGLGGIFLPIPTSKNEQVFERLRQIARKYDGEEKCLLHPWMSRTEQVATQKELPGFLDLERDMREIGPFRVRTLGYPHGTAEALIRFDNVDEVYLWLKRHGFQYIAEFTSKTKEEITIDKDAIKQTAIQDCYPENLIEGAYLRELKRQITSSRRITKTTPLLWADVNEFAKWLSCNGKFPAKSKRIQAAFIYENSD